MLPLVSVIIPARNDAAALALTLNHLERLPEYASSEILIAACGEVEEIQRAVAGRGRILWPGCSTRAGLMNAAAEQARGAVLFFLHADSLPPPVAFQAIIAATREVNVVGGAFEHRFCESLWSLRAISWINRRRYRITRNYYGDQGIFVRTDAFRTLGGYRDCAILEDLMLSQSLKKLGRTVLIRAPLFTSGRRFIDRGPWRTFGVIVWLLFLHTLRFDTQWYAERWRGPAGSVPGSCWPRLDTKARR
jgi:glycosyltransferase involved in cell wall biosynthesis